MTPVVKNRTLLKRALNESEIVPVVLDGGLAVLCNPKPADAGSKG